MTLDEAINQEKEIAKQYEHLVVRYQNYKDYGNPKSSITECAKSCKICAEEHRQFADWLKDYKRLLEQQPSDTVSRGAFEQVMWERDVAIGQLRELGYGLGQKIEPCDGAVSRKAVDELSRALVHTTRDKADFLCNFWEGLQKLPPVTQKSTECDDAISREAVYSILNEHHIDEDRIKSDMDERQNLTVNSIASDVSLLPSVTQKSGKWIGYNYPAHECVYCSNCKTEYYEDDLYLGGSEFPKYCPHCGCRMVEPQESEDEE